MTAAEIMAVGASRASFTTSVTAYLNRARIYLNDVIDELLLEADWTWRLKNSTVSITASGQPTSTFALGSDVMFPGEFTNYTDGWPMGVMTPGQYDSLDADRNDTGQPTYVVPLGISATTGIWQIWTYPIATATTTLDYWYWGYVPRFASSPTSSQLADTVDLDLYIPRHLQQCLYHMIAGKFFSSRGARVHANAERQEAQIIIEKAKRLQQKQAGIFKLSLPDRATRDNSGPLDVVMNGAMTIT